MATVFDLFYAYATEGQTVAKRLSGAVFAPADPVNLVSLLVGSPVRPAGFAAGGHPKFTRAKIVAVDGPARVSLDAIAVFPLNVPYRNLAAPVIDLVAGQSIELNLDDAPKLGPVFAGVLVEPDVGVGVDLTVEP